MQSDDRGFRIAVVAGELVNEVPGLDLLKVLERAGWGVIVLPPEWYPAEVATELLVQFAEHIQEFARHGYDVVCVGSCERLSAPLRQLGVEMPDSVTPGPGKELSRFLAGRPTPAACG